MNTRVMTMMASPLLFSLPSADTSRDEEKKKKDIETLVVILQKFWFTINDLGNQISPKLISKKAMQAALGLNDSFLRAQIKNLQFI